MWLIKNKWCCGKRLMQYCSFGFLLWCVFFVLPYQGYCASSDTMSILQVLDRVQQRYNVADFEADFTQSSRLEAVGIVDTAKGRASFKPPALMRWLHQAAGSRPCTPQHLCVHLRARRSSQVCGLHLQALPSTRHLSSRTS